MGLDVVEASSPPSFFDKKMWMVPYVELVEATENWLESDNWDKFDLLEAIEKDYKRTCEIDGFLQLKFDLVRGSIRKGHIDTILELVKLMAIPGWISPVIREEELSEVRTKAMELVKDPEKYWESLVFVLDAMIVGEEKNKIVLVMLVQGGEHIYVTGDSSIGKSFMKDKSLEVFPPEWIVSYGGMSQKAIQYTDFKYQGPGDEDNPLIRILNLQEFVNVGEEADKNFRLLSGDDGGMKWTTTVRDPDTKEFKTQEGSTPPLCFITSTTKSSLNEENMTRAWRLIPNPERDHTERIVKRDNLLAALPHRRPKLRDRMGIIRECMRILDPKKWKAEGNKFRVCQPFMQLCAFPYDKVRVRRDRSKIERISAIITIMNQYKRQRYEYDGQEYLLGTAGDLNCALFLVQDILEHTLLGIDDKAVKIYKLVKEWEDLKLYGAESDLNPGMTVENMQKSGKVPFSQKRIQEVSKELADTGYLRFAVVQERGSPHAYFIQTKMDGRLKADWTRKAALWRDIKLEFIRDGIEFEEGIDELMLDEGFPEALKKLDEPQLDMIEAMRVRMAARERTGPAILEDFEEKDFDDKEFKEMLKENGS